MGKKDITLKDYLSDARRNDKNRFKEYLQNREECKKLDAETIWTLGKLINIKELREYETEKKEEEIRGSRKSRHGRKCVCGRNEE